MFNNQPNKNQASDNKTNTTPFFGGLSNNSGGLFGNSSNVPNFGQSSNSLFGSSNPSGPSLFSNKNTTPLQTSQRKQGGLFGNIIDKKKQQKSQPPKLMFPGIASNNQSTSTLFGSSIGLKTDENKKQVSQKDLGLFSKNTPLFGGSQSLTGGLFNNIPQQQNLRQQNKAQQQKQTNSNNLLMNTAQPKIQKDKPLFPSSAVTISPSPLFQSKQDQKANNESKTLFGGSNDFSKSSTPFGQSGLFGNKQNKPQIQGGLFGKKDGGPQLKPSSGLFTPKQASQGPGGLFGLQSQGLKSGGLFSSVNLTNSNLSNNNLLGSTSSNQINTPLFGNAENKIQLKQPQKLSLTQYIPKVDQNKNLKEKQSIFNFARVEPLQNSEIGKQKTSLFQNSNKKTQENSLFNKSTSPFQNSFKNYQQKKPSLFSNQNAKATAFKEEQIKNINQKKPQVKVPSLFDMPKNKQTFQIPLLEKQQQNKSSSLFVNNSAVNKTTSTQVQKSQKIQRVNENQDDFLKSFGAKKNIDHKTTAEPTSNTIERTMSFNEPLNEKSLFKNQTNKSLSNQTKQGLFFNTNIITPQSTIPDSSPQPVQTNKSTLPSQTNQSSKKSFFKTQQQKIKGLSENIQKPLQPKDIIYTAYQISKLIQKQRQRQALQKTSSSIKKQKIFNKQVLLNIEKWINLSFTRYNQIILQKQNLKNQIKLHQNQDINRFLRDIVTQVLIILNLEPNENTYKFLNKLFIQMLDKLNIKEYLFHCQKIQINNSQNKPYIKLNLIQLNTQYFRKHQIYIINPNEIKLNLQSLELQQYIISLTKKYITNQLQYLEFIQNAHGFQLLKLPYEMFEKLLRYNLKFRKFRFQNLSIINLKNQETIKLVQDFEKKIINSITNILKNFLEDNFYSFNLIKRQKLNDLIDDLQNFSYYEEYEIIQTSLKVILNNINLQQLNNTLVNPSAYSSSNSPKIDNYFPQPLKKLIKDTRSIQMLPFRTILSLIQSSSLNSKYQRALPTANDLYRYINGPEWLDWLEVYLNNGIMNQKQKQIHTSQAKNLIKILKYPNLNTKRINRDNLSPKEKKYIQNLQKKILSRKRPICKFIMALKQENMLSIFYQILISLIYDYESYLRVQEMFFKQRQEFNYQFKNAIAQITNFPIQTFNEEIPFIQEKILYFLRIVEVAPQKIITLQKHLFQGALISNKKILKNSKQIEPMIEQTQILQSGHKICHLLIDSINYFGLKSNQLIISKSISAIKALLENNQTSLSMKIAMSINKPQFSFLSGGSLIVSSHKILSNLITQMNSLLEIFLTSDEFINSLSLNLKTNNSDDIYLQRIYPFRYSYREYLPFIKELLYSNNSEQLDSETIESIKQQKHIIITYSSYWFFKCLQIFILGCKQQKYYAKTNENESLHLINLMLEKLFIVSSIDIPIQFNVQKLMTNNNENTINRNDPVYPNFSSSSSIPKILLYLTQALNNIDIFSLISTNLKYKFVKTSYKFENNDYKKSSNYFIFNSLLQQDYIDNHISIYMTVKILKQIIKLYRLYEQEKYNSSPFMNIRKNNGQNSFMYKLLNRLKCIQQLQYKIFLKKSGQVFDPFLNQSQSSEDFNENNMKVNIIIGLMALFLVNYWNKAGTSDNKKRNKINEYSNFTIPTKPINLKHTNYQKPYIIPTQINNNSNRKSLISSSVLNQMQQFYSQNYDILNYQALNNFLIIPDNKYIQSSQSLQDLIIDCFKFMINGHKIFSEYYNVSIQPSISLSQYIGTMHISILNHDTSSNIFLPYSTNQWILEHFYNHVYSLLLSYNCHIGLKLTLLQFLYFSILSPQLNVDYQNAKLIIYRFLLKYLTVYHMELNYKPQEFLRVNLLVMKIINVLIQKDYYYFVEKINDKLLDNFIQTVIVNTLNKTLKNSHNIIKLIESFAQKSYYQPQYSYFHLQRTFEQRKIILAGQSYELLKQIILIIQKRFFDSNKQISIYDQQQNKKQRHKWICIKKINYLIINSNLPYLISTILKIYPNSAYIYKINQFILKSQQQIIYPFLTNLPRAFTRNPLQKYIIQSQNTSFHYQAFSIYKQNIIDWISFSSIQLNDRILKFLTWNLTINHTLYGNQPITIQMKQLINNCDNLNINTNIFCSLHNKNYKHSAIQLFGQSENQSINLIKNLYDFSFKKLEKGMIYNQIECYTIMSYCLEWLRARGPITSNILEHLIRNAIQNLFWLNEDTLLQENVVKYLLSVVNIGKIYLNNQTFVNVRTIIYKVIRNYRKNFIQYEQNIIQQLFSILISIPPLIYESSSLIQQIIQIWVNQSNNQYFYNQSRLILQMAQKYPNQIVKYKVLTLHTNNKIKKLSTLTVPQYYNYNLRSSDNISWIWVLKIASTIMSSDIQQSVMVFDQISEFYTLNEQKFLQLLITYPDKISIAYIQQLQATFEFILCLISSNTWINIKRNQFQKLTYILSHKTINLFNDYINSKINFLAISDIEQRLKKIHYHNYEYQEGYSNGDKYNINLQQFILGQQSGQKDSMFRILMQVKMISTMKIFISLLGKSFQQSWYVHKYFSQQAYLNYRYGTSFWDRINKSIIDLIRFNQSTLKRWKKCKFLNFKLILLNDCFSNSSEYFVQSGYLNSIHYVPSSNLELFQQLHQLSLYCYQLASVHLIQQKKFREKYNSLMKSHIQNYGKKILYNLKLISNQFISQNQNYQKNLSIDSFKDQHVFSKIQNNILKILKKS